MSRAPKQIETGKVGKRLNMVVASLIPGSVLPVSLKKNLLFTSGDENISSKMIVISTRV